MPTRRDAKSKINPLGLTRARLALIDEASDQELDNANKVGSIGFMARMLVQVPCRTRRSRRVASSAPTAVSQSKCSLAILGWYLRG